MVAIYLPQAHFGNALSPASRGCGRCSSWDSCYGGIRSSIWAILYGECGHCLRPSCRDSGPYTVVRHPPTTGALLEFIGLGITYANWLALIHGRAARADGLQSRRIGIEERALSQALGERYTHYMARTKRLSFPGVY